MVGNDKNPTDEVVAPWSLTHVVDISVSYIVAIMSTVALRLLRHCLCRCFLVLRRSQDSQLFFNSSRKMSVFHNFLFVNLPNNTIQKHFSYWSSYSGKTSCVKDVRASSR